jgi:hypothetical protein
MTSGLTPKSFVISWAAVFAFGVSTVAWSQGVPLAAKTVAPINLTGYWVSVINTDWQWRMVTPAKGDHNMVPITPAAQKILDNWDPAKDEANGEQCRAYGAPGLMRIPGRLHITWQDDSTLKVETDAGKQTRLLRFGSSKPPVASQSTWQGESAARWDMATGTTPDANGEPKFGSLHVVTTHLRAGYLRKNGLPYSADALCLPKTGI